MTLTPKQKIVRNLCLFVGLLIFLSFVTFLSIHFYLLKRDFDINAYSLNLALISVIFIVAGSLTEYFFVSSPIDSSYSPSVGSSGIIVIGSVKDGRQQFSLLVRWSEKVTYQVIMVGIMGLLFSIFLSYLFFYIIH